MYIPEFWCGVIVGAVACVAIIAGIGIYANSKNKKK